MVSDIFFVYYYTKLYEFFFISQMAEFIQVTILVKLNNYYKS